MSASELRPTLRFLLRHAPLVLAQTFAASTCLAHAIATESVPSDGAAVHRAPHRITLRFNVRIEQALTHASLRTGNAAPVPLLPLRSASGQSQKLVIPLPPLSAGAYEVRYTVLAIDGHATRGVLRFRVLP